MGFTIRHRLGTCGIFVKYIARTPNVGALEHTINDTNKVMIKNTAAVLLK